MQFTALDVTDTELISVADRYVRMSPEMSSWWCRDDSSPRSPGLRFWRLYSSRVDTDEDDDADNCGRSAELLDSRTAVAEPRQDNGDELEAPMAERSSVLLHRLRIITWFWGVVDP